MKKWALVIVGSMVAASCSPTANLEAGEKAVSAFHTQLDAGDIEAIYAGSTPAMKASGPKEQFVKFLDAVHRKLGQFQSGKTVGWRNNVTTSGHMLVISYAAKYKNGTADETFTYRFNGDAPALEGYNVNSPALVID